MKQLLFILVLALPCHGQMLQAIVGQSSAAAVTYKTSALVAGQTCEQVTTAASFPCTFPGNFTAGNGIECNLFYQSPTATVTAAFIANPPDDANLQNFTQATNSPVHGTNVSVAGHYVLSATASPSNKIIIETSASVTGRMFCEERTNFASFDKAVGATGTTIVNTDPISAGSLSTAQDNEILGFAGGIKSSGTDSFTITGWTIDRQRDGGSEAEFFASKTQTTAGSVTNVATDAITGEWAVFMMAFKTPAN